MAAPVGRELGAGGGGHDEGDVTVPSAPGVGLATVETEVVLGPLEDLLDALAQPGGAGELGQRGSGGDVGEVAGHRLRVVLVAPDQEPAPEA